MANCHNYSTTKMNHKHKEKKKMIVICMKQVSKKRKNANISKGIFWFWFEGRGQIKWRIKSHTSNSLLILVFLLLRCLGSTWQRIDGINISAASDSLWIWLSTRTGVRDNRGSLVAHSPRPFNGQKKTSRLGGLSSQKQLAKT